MIGVVDGADAMYTTNKANTRSGAKAVRVSKCAEYWLARCTTVHHNGWLSGLTNPFPHRQRANSNTRSAWTIAIDADGDTRVRSSEGIIAFMQLKVIWRSTLMQERLW